MSAPPSKSSIAGTPSNAEAKAGFAALWDYVVGLLGGDATAPAPSDAEKTAARTALGAMSSADGSVTYAKMQNVSAGKVLGRDTSGSGAVQELPIVVDSSGNVTIGGTTPWGKMQMSVAINNTAAAATRVSDFQGAIAVIHNQDNSGSGSKAGLFFAAAGSPGICAGVAGTKDGSGWATSLSFYTNAVTGGNLDAIQEQMRISPVGQQSSVIPGGSTTLYPEFKCRAWVNFNGTGTVAIRASGNVSSITDNGTGDYTVNFSTAMPDANYSVSGTSSDNSTSSNVFLTTASNTTAPSVSSVRVRSVLSNTGSLQDAPFISVSICR